MKGLKTISLNPFKPKTDLIDFTLSNAGKFYSSILLPLGVKGLNYYVTHKILVYMFVTITLPSRPQHPRIFLSPSEQHFWSHKFVLNQSRGKLKCTMWGHFFSVWRHGFFVLCEVHSQRVYLQEESSQPFLSCRMHQKNRSNFVLIIFYLQLINSGHADSSMADKKHSKLSSWR